MSYRPRRRPNNLSGDAEAPSSPFQKSPKGLSRKDRTDYEKPRESRSETFVAVLRSRGTVLVTLMVVQSLSGMILGHFEALIQDHVVITLFLTMLVGAGGNAGNQATVHIIRGLATGEVNSRTQWAILKNEANLGLVLGLLLSGVAFLRVALWRGEIVPAIAIGAACLVIVSLSVLVGAALPLLFVHFGIDAAHAGPAIQVAMDIIGVTFTCIICSAIFAAFAPKSAV